jgi:hypothetical protein
VNVMTAAHMPSCHNILSAFSGCENCISAYSLAALHVSMGCVLLSQDTVHVWYIMCCRLQCEQGSAGAGGGAVLQSSAS